MSTAGRLEDAMRDALLGHEVGRGGEWRDGPLDDLPGSEKSEAVRVATDTALRFFTSERGFLADEKDAVLDRVERLQAALAHLVLALHGTEVIAPRRHGKSTLKENGR